MTTMAGNETLQVVPNTARKVSKYGVFSGPNTGKCRPEKTPYLGHI